MVDKFQIFASYYHFITVYVETVSPVLSNAFEKVVHSNEILMVLTTDIIFAI